MPRIKSAIKRVQIAERNRLRNKATKATVRGLMKKVISLSNAYAANQQQETLQEIQSAMSAAFSRIDKAAKTGVLHKNTAARRKARLARVVKLATSSTGAS
ncbi:30S ribosomal protein S20 [Thermostichus vulcanus]|uniref:Small ribosomal subunit protein bS20 n=1 Tax=Thermostichus vulcanus str. 'Rupite' TaxID=2813851 RepID=A0ABT0CF05_THEVL|nr:30S ribosomal protein S20 [Thermostichus vulcanus]MCJ2544358.1 30S ribosomal protein S20 [Thermostichus vulcanus str. 'Rupite']